MMLQDKRVVVTGGTTGIGREVVRLLVEAGARVVTIGRTPEPAAEVEAFEGPGQVSAVVGDVSRREDLDRLFIEADDRFGGVDVLVVCAALGVGPLADTPEDEWRYVVETNLLGCLGACGRAVSRMRGQGGGQIVIVGSVSADLRAVGESVYAATKGGLLSFAHTLRKEVAKDRIKVTLVEPGATDTDMQECDQAEKARMVRDAEMLEAVEIAEGILFALTRSERCNLAGLRMEPLLQAFV
jgi:3-hydroxy acid dehydrogenase/malonic semialdehyde reductase